VHRLNLKLRWIVSACFLCSTTLYCGTIVHAGGSVQDQTAADSSATGIYTLEQAKRGAAIGGKECELCHGAKMSEGGEAPALSGEAFFSMWDGQTADMIYDRMRSSMPQTAPGKLSQQEYLDLMAQILHLNKFPTGSTELKDPEALKQIHITAKTDSK
jgi:hypothetical protein